MLYRRANHYQRWERAEIEYRADEAEFKRKFHDEIDTDSSGYLEREEIALLLDPYHNSHAIAEAYRLVLGADDDMDHELTKEEITNHADLFASSWFVEYGVRPRDDEVLESSSYHSSH